MATDNRAPVPVFHGERRIGRFLLLKDQGRIRFSYDEDWIGDPTTFPLSLSMPKIVREYSDQRRESMRPVRNYLWGLLPDNETTIERWSRHFGLRRKNPLALLCEIGADCPGAISFHTPPNEASLTPMDRASVVQAMQRLQESVPSQLEGDSGQFSLAGAQAKTALRQTDHGWAMPHGNAPSTHILKPAMPGLTDQAFNEHYCLELARRIGIPAAQSRVEQFGAIPVLVVTRFDRRLSDDHVERLHQEDMCQALGVHPANKYERDGGPGLSALMMLLDANSDDPVQDQHMLYKAVIFNVLIAGTDAHAKNFSIVHPPGGGLPRLAPLYDLNSLHPYHVQRREIRSSLKIGGHYKIHELQPNHLTRRIDGCRLTGRVMTAAMRELLETVPREAGLLAAQSKQSGIDSVIPDQIRDGIIATCNRLQRALDRAG